MLYLIECSSNIYACVHLSKYHVKVIVGYNGWYFYWSMFMLRLDTGKILRPRNTLQHSVDFNLVIGDKTLSTLLLLSNA